ncbi:hypothetical protein Pcinc_005569 [Petrolisthes cinctipes]|uniref:Uncharacterized protein n=1 Tax=Petrolisthes cinctipes TaxID=88211 RepID=A0AAE1GCF6_PETCI|nr:hypothetical protein Pcinc_010247 [Petrolisthes cinctipes]KAK3890489.1 hypothetical protein Pcinc_005569 [Petrolisthes cinctipes]
MDTKDTCIKQEPTAPGAESNDGAFPQVRDVTNKALMMVDGEADATQHTNQLSDLTLPIMDKVNILLNDNKFEELEEVKPDNRENQNDQIYFKVTQIKNGLHFHCLQNQNLPPETLTMPVSEMVKRLKPNITYTFLDMAWSGRRERVYIWVNPNTTEGRQFVDLCTGQRGSSFLNTRLTRVWNKGKAGECVFGGNYDSGVNRMLSSDGCCGERTVMFISHTDESGEFIINTNDKSPKFGIDIGTVLGGLKVLQEAAQLSDITQVTVVDCGVKVAA